jgi:hypothetical protein
MLSPQSFMPRGEAHQSTFDHLHEDEVGQGDSTEKYKVLARR